MKVTVSEIEALEKKSAQSNFGLVDNRPYYHLTIILKRYYEMSWANVYMLCGYTFYLGLKKKTSSHTIILFFVFLLSQIIYYNLKQRT